MNRWMYSLQWNEIVKIDSWMNEWTDECTYMLHRAHWWKWILNVSMNWFEWTDGYTYMYIHI